MKSRKIEKLLLAGGLTARQISEQAGCCKQQVYVIATRIGVAPLGPKRSDGRRRGEKRTVDAIRADLAEQLEAICARFNASVVAARRQEYGL